MFDAPQNTEIGRVLRASTLGFTIGCRVNQLDKPAFGSLVKAQPVDNRETIYGLIYNMSIADDSLVRRLILAENPKLEVINDQRRNRLLPVEMSVLAIGFRIDGIVSRGVPPRPPLNLDPVFLCTDRYEIIEFTERLTYLRLVLGALDSNVPVDQLLVSHLVNVYRERGDDLPWILEVIKELTEQLRNNFDVLIPTLEALSESLPKLTKTEL